MTTNKNVHFSPDDPINCVPTSHVSCTYCKSSRICPNKMKHESCTTDANQPEPVINKKANNLFD